MKQSRGNITDGKGEEGRGELQVLGYIRYNQMHRSDVLRGEERTTLGTWFDIYEPYMYFSYIVRGMQIRASGAWLDTFKLSTSSSYDQVGEELKATGGPKRLLVPGFPVALVISTW